MRLTRPGWLVVALMVLTVLAGLASGNNLLYLLYGLQLSSLLISAAALRLNLRKVAAAAEFPEHAFCGSAVRVSVRLKNNGQTLAHMLRVRHGAAVDRVWNLAPGQETTLSIDTRLPHRGKNRLEGLRLESLYPFGLLSGHIPIDAVGLAFPLPRLVRSAAELSADASQSGQTRAKKGSGDEIFGLRAYTKGDDSRLINWKLTARSGRTIVNEFAETSGAKVTVRVSAAGETDDSEGAIADAASACRHFIDQGQEVKLLTPEGEVGFGKGLNHLDRLLTALALLGRGKRPRPAHPKSRQAPQPGATRPLIRWTYLGGVLLFASLFLIEEIPRALLLSLSPMFAIGLWMDRKNIRIPQLAWQLSSMAVLAYILLIDWHRSGVTLANTHLLMYMFLNRILSEKTGRDLRQTFLIFFLAFFLVSGQTVSLWYFLYFVLYALFAGAWLMLATGEDPEQGIPTFNLSRLTAAVLGLTALLFALTPRLEPLRRMNPFVAMGLDNRAPKRDFVVRFSENVSLGWFGRLKKSSARVLRIRPLDKNRTPPPVLYVRGSAFDRFDGRRWSKQGLRFTYARGGKFYSAENGRAWIRKNENTHFFPDQPKGPAPSYQVTLYPLNSKVLFTVGTPRAITAPKDTVYFDHTDAVYFGTSYLAGTRYILHASPDPFRGFSSAINKIKSGQGRWKNRGEAFRELYLQTPAFAPEQEKRLRALAQQIVSDKQAARDKILAVSRYVRENHRYSLYSENIDKSLADFLFKSKSGNCEYFATASAILLRYAGIPTRLVTGFLASQWNEYGGFFDVRQGQAHAWVEALDPEAGWMPIDPTPPSDSLSQRTGALIERMRRYFAALQVRWYQNVIGYDSFTQRNTFHRLRWSKLAPALNQWADRLSRTAGWIVLAGAVLTLLRIAWKRPRRLSRFQRAERYLARAGQGRKPHQTPREYAQDLARRRPEFGALAGLVEIHYRDRYGGGGLSPAEYEKADRLLQEIRSASRQKN